MYTLFYFSFILMQCHCLCLWCTRL